MPLQNHIWEFHVATKTILGFNLNELETKHPNPREHIKWKLPYNKIHTFQLVKKKCFFKKWLR